MRRHFREEKATQAAARLLGLRGGRMSYMKLIKLLYLVEREALARFGAPFTNDSYVSMPYGPVLSATLDRINEPEMYQDGYWTKHITPKRNYEVALRDPKSPPPRDQLSPADEALIDEIYQRYGEMSRWDLVKLTHTLPEWVDPQGSAIPIRPDDILRSAGYSEEDIAAMQAEWDEAAYAEQLFG